MPPKKNKDDDWSSLLWGAAGVAVVGAAVYGASKYLSSSENTHGPGIPNDSDDDDQPGMVAEGRRQRRNWNPNAVLKVIHDEQIYFPDSERKRANQLVEKFIKDTLIPEMRKVDGLFDCLYRNLYYTGSYYDGLKISHPDEFDLNLVLDLSLPRDSFELSNLNLNHPGFTKVLIKDPSLVVPVSMAIHPYVDRFKKTLLEPDVNGGYHLMPCKLRHWIQSVTARAKPRLSQYFYQCGIQQISFRTSGPAMTLLIQMEDGHDIDVDLVPVFSFKPELLRRHARIWQVIGSDSYGSQVWLQDHSFGFQQRVRTSLGNEFFVVPKTPKTVQDNTQWRLDFHDPEKEILADKGCVKMVIRLLKLFKSANGLNTSSYLLKSIVMDMIRENPKYDWEQENLAKYFLEALESLAEQLSNGFVGYFFDPQLNILWDMHPNEMENSANRIKRILNKMILSQNKDECREVWRQCFGL